MLGLLRHGLREEELTVLDIFEQFLLRLRVVGRLSDCHLVEENS